jgi:4-hydroxyproline epimerase
MIRCRQPQLRTLPGKAWDRSPCGTGTSAKLACLAQDGKLSRGNLAPGQHHRQPVYRQLPAAGDKIIPTIRGEAWVCGDNQLILNPDDPFCWGIAP